MKVCVGKNEENGKFEKVTEEMAQKIRKLEQALE